MARKTKEDAQATRTALLDSAEHLFEARGVGRTSLADIAAHAGATRGAIYWHFKDKADLFNAMMERVALPMSQSLLCADLESAADPAQTLRAAILHAFACIEGDPQIIRVLQIATLRLELTEELGAIQQHHRLMQTRALEKISEGLHRAYQVRQLEPAQNVATTALGLQALFEGLLQQWLTSPGRFALQATVATALDVYLKGLGLTPLPGPSDQGLRAPAHPPRTTGQSARALRR